MPTWIRKTFTAIFLLLSAFIFMVFFGNFPLNAQVDSKPYRHKELTRDDFEKKKKEIKSKLKAGMEREKTDKKNIEKNNKGSKDELDLYPKKKIPPMKPFEEEKYRDPFFDQVKVDEKSGRVMWLPIGQNAFEADSSTPLELQNNELVSLDRSISIALARSPRVKTAYEKMIQSVAQYEEAKTAKNPSLTLSGQGVLQGPSSEINFSIPPLIEQNLIFSRDYNVVGQLSLQQLITTFGKVENQIAAAFINIRKMQESIEAEKMDVTFEVKRSFYAVLKGENLIKVANEYLRLSRDYLGNARSLYNNGVVSRYDVVRSELSVSQSLQTLMTAKKTYMLARAAFLFNLDYDDVITFQPKPRKRVVLKDSLKLEYLYEAGLANRREIREMNEDIAAAKKLLQAARAQTNPSVYLSANYTRMTATSMSQDYSWEAGLSISIPIYDGGVKSAMIKNAESTLRYAEIALDSLKRQVRLEVEQAYLDLKESKTKFNLSMMDVRTSMEGYRIAKVRYANGLSNSTEMDDALKSLNESNVNLVNAMYDYELTLSELERNIGRDFTPDEMEAYRGGNLDEYY